MTIKRKLRNDTENTWCPGCPNHMIENAFKETIAKFVDSKRYRHGEFAITADVGCHAKIFDYVNVSGIYCLHGRALPTALGMKLGNPNLKVITFAGDGAAYSEGISHLIHAFQNNFDMTYIVHDNQAFSLTTGQATSMTQQGYESKSEPLGVNENPMNPLAIALASGASFIARTNARDTPHMIEVFTKAVNHKGFSFVEVIQDCIIFNLDVNNKDSIMYKIRDNVNLPMAKKLVDEYNYNAKLGKLPIGVLYKENRPSLESKWPQLQALMKHKVNWQKKPTFLQPVKKK